MKRNVRVDETVVSKTIAIVTSKAKIWMGSDGILRVVMHPGSQVGPGDISEMQIAAQQICGNRFWAIPQLVDISNVKYGVMKSADERRVNDRSPAAVGVVVGGADTLLISNYYLGLYRQDCAKKVFKDEASALSWLRSFLE